MCDPVIGGPLMAALTGGGATAAGAAAAAGGAAAGASAGTGVFSSLAGLGKTIAIGGSILQGIQSANAARENADLVQRQMDQEKRNNTTKAERERLRFRSMMAQQRAELAGRGVQLDSPTAVFLGETAAREMSFNDQSIRATGQAVQTELSAEQRSWRARGTSALLRGGLSAASGWLNREPEQWKELLA
jgi:hypothetical protein